MRGRHASQNFFKGSQFPHPLDQNNNVFFVFQSFDLQKKKLFTAVVHVIIANKKMILKE